MENIEKAYFFLNELRNNNNRNWFEANKTRYNEIQEWFKHFVNDLISEIEKFDEDIKESHLEAKDCTYRIYRDIRFSKDKTPYKQHLGTYICKGGKKSQYSGYYFHLEPFANNELETNEYGFSCGSIICSGLYKPDIKIIRSIRDEISVNGDPITEAINKAKGFKLDSDYSLKKLPLGYNDVNEKWQPLLKLKNYTITQEIDKDFLFSPHLAKRVAREFKKTHAFVKLINKAVEYSFEEN